MYTNNDSFSLDDFETASRIVTGRLGVLTPSVRAAVLKCYDYTCQHCKGTSQKPASVVDHIIPVNPRLEDYEKIQAILSQFPEGALDCLENLTAACVPCNSRKRNFLLSDKFLSPLLVRASSNKQKIISLIKKDFGINYSSLLESENFSRSIDSLLSNLIIGDLSSRTVSLQRVDLSRKIFALVGRGANLASCISENILFWAAVNNQVDQLDAMIKAGKFRDFYRKAISFAIEGRAPAAVEILLKHSSVEISPLFSEFVCSTKKSLLSFTDRGYASLKNTSYVKFATACLDILEILLSTPAKLSVQNTDAHIFYPMASQLKRAKCIDLLIEREFPYNGRKQSKLLKASILGEKQLLASLVAFGEVTQKEKDQALLCAFIARQFDTVIELILLGADPTENNGRILSYAFSQASDHLPKVVEMHGQALVKNPRILQKAVDLYLLAKWDGTGSGFSHYPDRDLWYAATNLVTLLNNSFLKEWPVLPRKNVGHKVLKRALKTRDLRMANRLLDLGVPYDAADETLQYAASKYPTTSIYKRIAHNRLIA